MRRIVRVRSGPRAPGRAEPRRGAFTTAELVVSMAAGTILMGGIASAVVLSLRSLPDAGKPSVQWSELSGALTPFLEDLACATSFSERTALAVTFTVGDRNSDAVPEVLRYSWSGVAGEPLLRKLNAAAAVPVVANVQSLSLSYATTTVAQSAPPAVESGESALATYDSAVNLSLFSVNSGNWISQHFVASVPNDAVSWRPTRVRLKLGKSNPGGNVMKLQLRTADAARLPTATILEEVTVLEASAPSSMAYYDVPLCAVTALVPGQGYCIVLTSQTSGDSFPVQQNAAAITSSDLKLAISDTSGASWTGQLTGALIFSVYGTVTTPPAAPPDKHYATGVGVTLTTGGSAPLTAESTVSVAARPEVPTP